MSSINYIYHRGDTGKAQENSLDAILCGYDLVEIDINCDDDNFYLMHDMKNISIEKSEKGKMVFNKNVNYHNGTLKYEKERPVATFQNLLETCENKDEEIDVKFCLDLKMSRNFQKHDIKRVDKLIDLINMHHKRIMYVSSFNINLFIYINKKVIVDKGLFMSADTIQKYRGEDFVKTIKPQYLIYSIDDSRLMKKLNKVYNNKSKIVLYTVHTNKVKKLDDEILNRMNYVVVDTF